MMELRLLPAFTAWLDALRDEKARALILRRLARLRQGNPGDVKPVGSGVSELRIDHGPGYRVYVRRAGLTVVVVLGGGDKRSQTADIQAAIAAARIV